MLTLFEGGFASPMHEGLIDAIRASVGAHRRVYLIVPEQETVNAECEMSEVLPASAPLYFEVTNFTRFTNTAFREIGGISGEYCSPVSKSLIMWRTLTELMPMLGMTRGRRNISDGLVRKALSAVGEMQSLGISPEMLALSEGKDVGDGRLREKLSDLTLIYTLYTRLVGERFSDTMNDAAALTEMLSRDASFLLDTEIFIDGFTSFTEPQTRLIGEIMRHAPVTVTLMLGRGGEAYEYTELIRTKRRLTTLADAAGVEKRLKKFGSRDMAANPVISEIGDLLWRSSGKIDNDSLQILKDKPETLRIFRARTAYEEARFIASDVRRRIEAGARYSDLAIVARSTDPYIGILDEALSAAGIPHFISKPSDLSPLPLFKLITAAYRIVTGGWHREDLITYMKSGISGISRDEEDKFELYTERWGIDGARFKSGAWGMPPRGYGRAKGGDAELLASINATRVKLTDALSAFEAAIAEAKSVKSHATALLSFLSSIEAEEKMAKRSEALLLRGESEAADLEGRAWGVLCDALDVLVDILGEVPADATSFLSQLTVAINGAAVGSIPSRQDAVTVGGADMIRLGGKRHVYMIGVNAGEFPASISETSYFAENERLKLGALGLPIEPELEIKGARELYSFSRAFTSATESVTLLYAEKTATDSPLLPSDVIERIKTVTSGRVTPKSISQLKLADTLYTEAETLEALGGLSEKEASEAREALLAAGFGEQLRIADGRLANDELTVSPDTLALLYGKDIYLSQTKIDKFLGCPMSYFCKYNLHLDTDEAAELGSNVIGSFVHSVIEGFFKKLEASGKNPGALTNAERDAITAEAVEGYAGELIGTGAPSSRTRVAVSRLVRATRPVVDGLCDELSASGFAPRFFELETSMHDPNSPDHVIIPRGGGGKIILRGTIDRVDTYKSGDDVYVRVIDYKTGYIDFLPSKLGEGEYLQMFLYLKAVTDTKKPEFLKRLGVGEGGRVIPAGVIYVKSKVKDATVRSATDEAASDAAKAMQEREGMLLDDKVSLDAMNPDFLPPEKKRSEPLRYDAAGWREIERTLTEVTRSVADGMTSGNVKATPATKGGRNCKWCKYKEICRSAVIKNDF